MARLVTYLLNTRSASRAEAEWSAVDGLSVMVSMLTPRVRNRAEQSALSLDGLWSSGMRARPSEQGPIASDQGSNLRGSGLRCRDSAMSSSRPAPDSP